VGAPSPGLGRGPSAPGAPFHASALPKEEVKRARLIVTSLRRPLNNIAVGNLVAN